MKHACFDRRLFGCYEIYRGQQPAFFGGPKKDPDRKIILLIGTTVTYLVFQDTFYKK